MLDNHVFVFPIVLLIYIPASFFITYGIAVKYEHVEAVFPYISDTGTFSPESCAFGQLLNIGALLCSIVVYIRYKQIEKFYRGNSPRKILLKVNIGCFILGLAACLGLSIVANFQETNVITVHMIGAFFAFGFGGIYCLIQAAMSFRMMDMPGSHWMILAFRVLLCVGDLISLVLFLEYFGAGSEKHVVSAAGEWAAGIITVIFLATYIGEFRKFSLQAPEVIFSENQINRNENYASNVVRPTA